jgi:hypothetical protein
MKNFKPQLFVALLAMTALFATTMTSCKAKQTHCAAYGSISKPNNKMN